MSRLRSILQVNSNIKRLLNKNEQHSLDRVVVLSIGGAILELLGIAVLLHTVLSILRPDFIDHNTITSWLKRVLSITDNRVFLLTLSTLLLVVYILKNSSLVIINKKQIKIAYQISDIISNRLFTFIGKSEYSYFKKNKTSEIINSLILATINFPESIVLPSILLWSELVVILILLAAILIYNPYLFLFTVVVMVPAAVILIRINRKKLLNQGEEFNKNIPRLLETINELAMGMANIKLWNGLPYFIEKYNSYKQDCYKLKQKIHLSAQYIPLRMYEVIAIAGILCIVVFGIITGYDLLSIISFVSIYAGVSFRLLPSINRVIGASNHLATHNYVLESINYETIEETASSAINQINFEKTIQLTDVSFAYENGKQILSSINLEIKKGEYVGLIGKSGEGKSTLVNVITSLLIPTSGEIRLDGRKLSAEEFPSYRYLFSYVKQDIFMLNSSILENVAFLAKDVDLEKVKKCLKQVNLWEWVSSLRNGLDTRVGELGNKISGGQRQRIAIARALYKDADIFIFDEVTNNLDLESKAQTLKAIEMLREEEKTAILITHKPEELAICDTVYTIENAKLTKQSL